MEPQRPGPSVTPSPTTQTPAPASTKKKSDFYSKIGFFSIVQESVSSDGKGSDRIGKLFNTTVKPQNTSFMQMFDSDETKIKNEVKSLIGLLKDPEVPKSEMGTQAIAGAYKVLTYLEGKAQESSSQSKSLAQLRTDFAAAENIYQKGFDIVRLPIELLGGHGIPDKMSTVSEFIESLPKTVPAASKNTMDVQNRKIDKDDIYNFLKGCNDIKLMNLQALSRDDGSYGYNDTEECMNVTDLYLKIRAYVQNNKVLPESDKEVIQSVLKTILEGSFTRNTQLNADLFEAVIPQEMRRPEFIEDRLKGKSEMIKSRLESEPYLSALKRIQDNPKLTEPEKDKAIKELKKDQLYDLEEQSLLYTMENWSNASTNPAGFFMSADRTIGYMALDRQKKLEFTMPLDLTNVKLGSAAQVKQVFTFLHAMQSYPNSEVSQAWTELSKKPALQTYENLVKIIEKDPRLYAAYEGITDLSEKQKTELLKSALDFTSKITQFAFMARLSLSQES